MRNIFNVLIWNFNTQTIEEYNEVSDFISNEYKASVEQINL